MRVTTLAAVIACLLLAVRAEAATAQGRQITVIVVGAGSGEESRRMAQKECISFYMGDDVSFGFGGDGSVFVGGRFNRSGGKLKFKPLFGLGANLALALRLRIGSTSCNDPRGQGDAPEDTRTLTIPFEGNNQTFFVSQIGLAGLALNDFERFSAQTFNGAIVLLAGVEREYVWWSKPADYSSKKTGFIGAGVLIGGGSFKDSESPDAYAAGLTGLLFRFGVRLF